MGKPDTCYHRNTEGLYFGLVMKKVRKTGCRDFAPTWQWLGSNARIEKDGSVILFEKDSYTPQELWRTVRNVSTQSVGVLIDTKTSRPI